MIPIVTPDEMAAIDAAATEPVEVLIERAGAAVARHAIALLGGAYGRSVAVIVGRGNNGNDGRVAARRLRARGARVIEIAAESAPSRLPEVDLVIDAAYGTGLTRPYDAPARSGTPLVVAVDVPSGVDGATGELRGTPMPADLTVTFAALKPGLLFQPARGRCGEIVIADVGLDVSRARAYLVEAHDVAVALPPRDPGTHKWRRATWVIGGSPGMTGAPQLAAMGAARAGAGYVRISIPGDEHAVGLTPIEAVQVPVGSDLVVDPVEVGRVQSMIIGPGLGRAPGLADAVCRIVASLDVALVVDGDALVALGDRVGDIVQSRQRPTVLTPHDGEYLALMGRAPGADRIDAARALARRSGAVVLLKGPTTVVADGYGDALIVLAGDARLATAGTGDVLSGIIGALLAQGVDARTAAGIGAYLHGAAAMTRPPFGMIAGDVARALPKVMSRLLGEGASA
ncbi:MAG TPA: NAD(P)H-hydrate dehydratase [Acidimicrobiales bacterium]|nr:NAD(P)H-hydrate dehydratase [Acidimicrobiales bacterium]